MGLEVIICLIWSKLYCHFKASKLFATLHPWNIKQDQLPCEQLAEWDWNPSTNATFQYLKSLICLTLFRTTLTSYDRTKPVIMWTDTSDYGLNAALIHERCPITYTSKTLNNVETWYADIKCECLSLWYSISCLLKESNFTIIYKLLQPPYCCCFIRS